MIRAPATADALFSLLWGTRPSSDRLLNGDLASCLRKKPYLDYFRIQCGYFAKAESSVQENLDVIKDVVGHLKTGASKKDVLSLRHTAGSSIDILDNASVENAANLAARLLIMCSVGRVPHEANPRQYLEWRHDESLKDLVCSHFQSTHTLNDAVRLPKNFNAWTIEKIGGITIQLTDSLADHLLLANDDRTLLIFHHVSFLERQTSRSILPKELVDETLHTLGLLFPQALFTSSNRSTRQEQKWFKRLCQRHFQETHCEADDRVARCGTLQANERQVERFHYWRDRLVVLKQMYDDSTPATLSQWWFDRRNGPQWYTFWVAALVLFITTLLGLVQCIESALQVYKAYYPS
ncbi:hypothetical protein S40293_01100 [Stachybotrys chartarum IBT 40293]|nr:hypothetical protein S40293_01100 [Stachybotrys chartarum IBT 40293]